MALLLLLLLGRVMALLLALLGLRMGLEKIFVPQLSH